MDPIDTARLRLEPLGPAHADALYAIYSDPAVRRFLITCPNDRFDFDRLFAHALGFAATHGMWAVTRKPSGEVIGRLGFFAFGAAARPELAFLLSSACWGQGLATEAASAALRDAFLRRDWRAVVALVRPGNRAAIRVLAKLGMMYEQSVTIRQLDVCLYQVTRGGFAAGTVEPS